MSDKPTFKIVPVEPTKEMKGILERQPYGPLIAWHDALCASPPAPSVEEIKQFILEAGQEIEFASSARALLVQFEAMEKEDE